MFGTVGFCFATEPPPDYVIQDEVVDAGRVLDAVAAIFRQPTSGWMHLLASPSIITAAVINIYRGCMKAEFLNS